MVAYRINVALMDVPDAWRDQSITAFRIPAPAGTSTDGSFVVTRDDERGTGPFAGYVAKQKSNCENSLDGFELIRFEELRVKERDAAWLEFTWSREGTALLLRQVYFDCGLFATICTLTCAPGDVAHHDAPWRAVMASLTFDRADPAPAFPPEPPLR